MMKLFFCCTVLVFSLECVYMYLYIYKYIKCIYIYIQYTYITLFNIVRLIYNIIYLYVCMHIVGLNEILMKVKENATSQSFLLVSTNCSRRFMTWHGF